MVRILLTTMIATDQKSIITGLLKEILAKDPYNEEALHYSQNQGVIDNEVLNYVLPFLKPRVEKWTEGLGFKEEKAQRINKEMATFEQFEDFANEFSTRMPFIKSKKVANQPERISELQSKYFVLAPVGFGKMEYDSFVSGNNKTELTDRIEAYKKSVMENPSVNEMRRKLCEQISYESLLTLVKEIEVEKTKFVLEKDDLFGKMIGESMKLLPLIPRNLTEREMQVFLDGENLDELDVKFADWKSMVLKDDSVPKETKDLAESATLEYLSRLASQYFQGVGQLWHKLPTDNHVAPVRQPIKGRTIEIKPGTGKTVGLDEEEINSEKQKGDAEKKKKK
jgi:hypothetical protein